MILGISTGSLHGQVDEIYDRVRLVELAGFTAIELMFHGVEELLSVSQSKLLPLLESFEYISLHAPTKCDADRFEYSDTSLTRQVLQKLKTLQEVWNLKGSVIHADLVREPNIILESGVVVWVENSDSRKELGKSVNEMRQITTSLNDSMVLDINHLFSIDPSMQLYTDYTKTLGDRISEFHVSGYDEELLHIPLTSAPNSQIKRVLPQAMLHGAPLILEGTDRGENWFETIKQEKRFMEELYESGK